MYAVDFLFFFVGFGFIEGSFLLTVYMYVLTTITAMNIKISLSWVLFQNKILKLKDYFYFPADF